MNLDLLKEKPFYLNEEDINWVKETYQSLSLDEKVGQIFLPLCSNPTMENLQTYLDMKVTGVCRMAGAPLNLLRNSAKVLQEKSKVPLFLTGDLEFGSFGKISGGTEYQTQLGVSATGKPEIAGKMGTMAAREGKCAGFNWSFTPVVDISYNYFSSITSGRSFGSDPERVLTMAREYVKGMQQNGMAACAKHWPGDGVDARDQHLVTTINSLDMTTWRKTYGKIYQALIDDGVKTIMSAHITLPAYNKEKDPKVKPEDIKPATISKELNINLLREELGFNGVIISDATGMAGLTSQGPREEIFPMVIQNGCDIFLFSVEDDIDFAILKNAAKTGKITPDRLAEAVLRVLGLKASLGLHKMKEAGNFLPAEEEMRLIMNCDQHQEWSQQCLERSITLVKDTQEIIPINPKKHQRVLIIQSDPIPFITAPENLKVGKFLEKEGLAVTYLEENTTVDQDLYDLVIYLLNQKEFFGTGDFRIPWAKIHKNMMGSMRRYWWEIPTIMISFGNPWHLYDAPRVKTYINAYSDVEGVQREVVQMLLGKKPFKGINPVDPFCGLFDARL